MYLKFEFIESTFINLDTFFNRYIHYNSIVLLQIKYHLSKHKLYYVGFQF